MGTHPESAFDLYDFSGPHSLIVNGSPDHLRPKVWTSGALEDCPCVWCGAEVMTVDLILDGDVEDRDGPSRYSDTSTVSLSLGIGSIEVVTVARIYSDTSTVSLSLGIGSIEVVTVARIYSDTSTVSMTIGIGSSEDRG